MRKEQLASYISRAIRENLERAQAGDWDNVAFEITLEEYNPAIYNDPAFSDPALRAAWNFADQFFFELQHGDPKMDHLSWDQAFALMEEVAERLESNEPITDERVLSYYHPPQSKLQSVGCLLRGLFLVAIVILLGAAVFSCLMKHSL